MSIDNGVYNYSLPLSTASEQQDKPTGTTVSINEDLMRKVVEADLAAKNAHTRQHEAQLYLSGMAEIRMALNFAGVSDNDTGMNERPPIKPIFENDIDVARLQTRYFALLDRYLAYTQRVSAQMNITDEKFPE